MTRPILLVDRQIAPLASSKKDTLIRENGQPRATITAFGRSFADGEPCRIQ